MSENKKIVVFCGSKEGDHPNFVEHAKQIGQLLAENSFDVIFGGDPRGLMNALADGVLESKGAIHGYTVAPWNDCRSDLTSSREFQSPTERKQAMKEADAYILMPGGLGSLGEFFDALDHNVMLNHADQPTKPLGILNTQGFYSNLHQQIMTANTHGFIHDRDRSIYFIENEPQAVVDQIKLRLG